MKIDPFLWLLPVCLFSGSAVGQVEIYPGTDIQSVVSANSPGTTYLLMAGVHSLQSIQPQNGDVYIGEPGAVMSGAIQLSDFVPAGSYWAIGDQVPQGVFTWPPYCEDGYDGCTWSEDLFIDNQPLQHVMSIDELVPGAWYFDMDANTIYIADDPNGHVVERSIAPVAFTSGGRVTGVTIQNLVIEKYAAPARQAAIEADYGWTITNNEVRFNHGTGINLVDQATVTGNNIHHNGQMGLGAWMGDQTMVAGNEIAYNNFAHFERSAGDAEAGGTKFTNTTNLQVVNNFVHDNLGPGLWTDGNNSGVVYDSNTITDNETMGIQHEVSFEATISNNTIRNNGKNPDNVMNAQIFISNSRGAEIFGNIIELDSSLENSIILFQTDVDDEHNTTNNYVHDNSITFDGPFVQIGRGQVGFWDYGGNPDPLYDGSNLFDRNSYYADPSDIRWLYHDSLTWDGFVAVGQEPNGTAGPSGSAPAKPRKN